MTMLEAITRCCCIMHPAHSLPVQLYNLSRHLCAFAQLNPKAVAAAMQLSILYSYDLLSHQVCTPSSTLELQCNCLADLNKHLLLLCRIYISMCSHFQTFTTNLSTPGHHVDLSCPSFSHQRNFAADLSKQLLFMCRAHPPWTTKN